MDVNIVIYFKLKGINIIIIFIFMNFELFLDDGLNGLLLLFKFFIWMVYLIFNIKWKCIK